MTGIVISSKELRKKKRRELWQHKALKCSGRFIQEWSHTYPKDERNQVTDVKCGFNHRVNHECVNNIEYMPCLFESCPFVHWATFPISIG